MVSYEEALSEANAYTEKTFKAPQRKVYDYKIIFSVAAAGAAILAAGWAKDKGSTFLKWVFLAVLVLVVIKGIKDFIDFLNEPLINTSPDIYIKRFLYQEFLPHMIQYFYPDAECREGISKDMGIVSGHIGHEKEYLDLGTWSYQLESGIKVSFTQIVTAYDERNGLLLRFENVREEKLEQPVLILCNIDEHEREIQRKLGFSKRKPQRLQLELNSLARGAYGKVRVAQNDKVFNNYYLAYCADKRFGESFLNGQYQNKLLELHEKYDNMWFGISHVGKDVYIYVNSRLGCHVGTNEKQKIREDLFERFYRFMTEQDVMLSYALGDGYM